MGGCYSIEALKFLFKTLCTRSQLHVFESSAQMLIIKMDDVNLAINSCSEFIKTFVQGYNRLEGVKFDKCLRITEEQLGLLIVSVLLVS